MPTTQRASAQSLHQRLLVMRQRIHNLVEENQRLRSQLAVALGQPRAGTSTSIDGQAADGQVLAWSAAPQRRGLAMRVGGAQLIDVTQDHVRAVQLYWAEVELVSDDGRPDAVHAGQDGAVVHFGALDELDHPVSPECMFRARYGQRLRPVDSNSWMISRSRRSR
jgi:hypothetical protein